MISLIALVVGMGRRGSPGSPPIHSWVVSIMPNSDRELATSEMMWLWTWAHYFGVAQLSWGGFVAVALRQCMEFLVAGFSSCLWGHSGDSWQSSTGSGNVRGSWRCGVDGFWSRSMVTNLLVLVWSLEVGGWWRVWAAVRDDRCWC